MDAEYREPNCRTQFLAWTVMVSARPSRSVRGANAFMGSAGDFHWNGAWGTLWWADPKEDLAAVFMAQVPRLEAAPWAIGRKSIPGFTKR